MTVTNPANRARSAAVIIILFAVSLIWSAV
jgi:hypothetical protein